MARLRRWELRACARHGHATYAPTEPALAGRLSGTTGVGEVWRCLRCSDFVLGPPHARGPADEAPLVLRGKALRQAVILRLLAAERLVRAVLLGVATYGVLRFRDARGSIQAWLERYLPALRATGVHVDQFALVRDLQHALAARSSQPTLVAALLGAYAALEAIEGVGLWLLKRWGEYFAAVATAIFLPLEVRELIKGVTFTRAGAFAINVAAVIYLLLAKRLFGLRGGLDLEQRVVVTLLVVGCPTAAQAEQPLGEQQVDDSGDVDGERAGAGERDALDQFAHLQRQEDGGRDRGEVLAPALEQPQSDALDGLQGGVRPEQRRHQGELGRPGGQRMLQVADQRELIDVDAGRPKRRQVALQPSLNRAAGVAETQHAVCRQPQQHRPQQPLGRQEPQDDRLPQRLPAQHQRRLVGGAAGAAGV